MTRRWTCSLLAPLACCMTLAAVLPSSTALGSEEPASESQRNHAYGSGGPISMPTQPQT